MPKIPEGNFRTEPSSRVPAVPSQIIKPNTQKLRELGREAKAVGDAMEKAQQRVESLKISRDSADRWQNQSMPVIDNLFKTSKAGYTSDGKKLQDAVRDEIEKFNTRELASLGDNPETGAFYSKYVASEFDGVLRKAETEAAQQIESHAINQVNSNFSLLREKLINGTASVKDINKSLSYAQDSVPLYGQDNHDKLVKGFWQGLAANADQITLYHPEGLSQSKINETKRLINLIPDEATKLAAMRKFDHAVQKRSELEESKTDGAMTKLEKSIDKPMDLGVHAQRVEDARNYYFNAPMGQYESEEKRINTFSKMEGKVQALKALNRIGGLDPKDPQLVEVLTNPESSPEFNEAWRRFASSNMSKVVDNDTAKEKFKQRFLLHVNSGLEERKNNPRKFQKKFFPSAEMQLQSKKPEFVIPQIIQQQKAWGITTEGLVLADEADAKKDGKLFKSWREGADDTGQNYINWMNEQSQTYGEYTYKLLRDSANFGGADPTMMFALQGDDDFKKMVSISHGSFDRNVAQLVANKQLATKEEGVLSVSTGKKNLEKMVIEHMKKESNNFMNAGPNVNAMIYGAGGRAVHEGILKSITYMAAQRAASKGDGGDIREAVEESYRDFFENFPMKTDSGVSSIQLPKTYMDKNGITEDGMSDMLKSSKQLLGLKELGIEIRPEDFDIPAVKKNRSISGKLAAAKGFKKFDPQRSTQEFLEIFEDNIVVKNDPNEPNNIKLYLQDNLSGNLIQIPIRRNGKKQVLSIDASEYKDALDLRMQEARSMTGGVTSVSF